MSSWLRRASSVPNVWPSGGLRRSEARSHELIDRSKGERKMREGWACPKCGAVFAPFVASCTYCKPQKVVASSADDRWTIPKPPTMKKKENQ